MPTHFANFRLSPRELFKRHGLGLWHITVTANLPEIVKQGGILSDALQQVERLDPYCLFGWGDIFGDAPIRGYVPLAIADPAELKELLRLEPRPPTLAVIQVADSLLDGDGVCFFPGWPEAMDLGRDGEPGLTGNRGAAWLLAPSGKAWPRGTVFVPEYIDLSDIDEVNLIDPLPEDDSVYALDGPPGCQVQVADLKRWGITPRPEER